MQTIKRKLSQNWVPLLLIVFALAVYLPGITWGIPHPTGPDFTHAWGNDDLVPLAPLAEMHNTFIVAKPDRNIAYPWFHYFFVACTYGPYLVYLLLTGGLVNPSPVFPFGLSDPVSVFRHLSYIGRSVTLALALATVVGAYYTGKHLWGCTAGFLAAIFTMLMFPMAYYARLGNLDVPALGWTSLALATLALSLRNGLTVRRGAWFGAFSALAIATKTFVGSFVFVVPALIWLHFREGTTTRLWRWSSVWASPCAITVSFLITYVVASGIPIDPVRYWQHMAKLATVTATNTLYLRHPSSLVGYAAHLRDLLGYLVDVMSWPVLIAAMGGIVLAFRRDRPSLVLALSSLGFFFMLLPVRFSKVHYLLPVALPLNAFAAYAFAQGLEAKQRTRVITAMATIAVSGLLLLQTVDLTHNMIFDSRYRASAWLDQHTRPGDRVLYFGAGLTVPPLRPDIETIKVAHRQEALPTIMRRKPDFILVMPLDFNEDRHRVEWRYGPHSIYSDYVPTEVWKRLVDESLEYRLVAKYQTPRLFPWMNRPFLSYASVNPPIQIFARKDRTDGMSHLEPWASAPHYPKFSRVRELTIDSLEASER